MGAEKATAQVVKTKDQTKKSDSIESRFNDVKKVFDVDAINEYIKTADEELHTNKSKEDAILIMKHISAIKDDLLNSKLFPIRNEAKMGKPGTKNKYIYQKIESLFNTAYSLFISDSKKNPEKFIKSCKKNPLQIIQVANLKEKTYPSSQVSEKFEEMFQYLTDTIKPQKLDGKMFLSYLNELTDDKIQSEAVKGFIFKILITSEDIPFENIVDFKKVIRLLAESYPSHKSDFLIKLALKRGQNILNKDSQTKEEIDKILGNCEYGKLQKEIEKTVKRAGSLIDNEKYGKALGMLSSVHRIEFREQGKVKEITGWTNYVSTIITQVLGTALELKQEAMDGLIEKGEALYEEKKYDEALKSTDEILKVLPLHSGAIKLSTKCLFQINYRKAKTAKTLEGPSKPGEKIHKIPGYNVDAFAEKVEQSTQMIDGEDLDGAIRILDRLEKYDNPVVDYLLLKCYTVKSVEATEKGSSKMEKMESMRAKTDKYEVIGNAIPHFTEGLQQAKIANKYQKKIQSHKLDYSWSQDSDFTIAVNSVGRAHNTLSTNVGGRSALIVPDQYRQFFHPPHKRLVAGKIGLIPVFQDYLDQSENLPPKKRKELAQYHTARADLLGTVHKKRKSTVWDLYKIKYNQSKRVLVELKDKTHARKHSEKRKALGLDSLDIIEKLSDFTSLKINNKINKTVSRLRGIMDSYGELHKKLETIKGVSDKDEDEDDKDTVKNIKIQIRKIKERLDEVVSSLDFQINQFLISGEGNEKTRESAKEIQMLIRNRNILLTLAVKSAEKVEFEDELPEASTTADKKEGEESIDYEVELALELAIMESYIKAIETDPSNFDNYMRLVVFLEKIDFHDYTIDEVDLKTALKSDAKKVSEQIINMVKREIAFKTGPILAELGVDPRSLPGHEHDRNEKTLSELGINDFTSETTDGEGGEIKKNIKLIPTTNPSYPRKPKKRKKGKNDKGSRFRWKKS